MLENIVHFWILVYCWTNTIWFYFGEPHHVEIHHLALTEFLLDTHCLPQPPLATYLTMNLHPAVFHLSVEFHILVVKIQLFGMPNLLTVFFTMMSPYTWFNNNVIRWCFNYCYQWLLHEKGPKYRYTIPDPSVSDSSWYHTTLNSPPLQVARVHRDLCISSCLRSHSVLNNIQIAWPS